MKEILSNQKLLLEMLNYTPHVYKCNDLVNALKLRFIDGVEYSKIPLKAIPNALPKFVTECRLFERYLSQKGLSLH